MLCFKTTLSCQGPWQHHTTNDQDRKFTNGTNQQEAQQPASIPGTRGREPLPPCTALFFFYISFLHFYFSPINSECNRNPSGGRTCIRTRFYPSVPAIQNVSLHVLVKSRAKPGQARFQRVCPHLFLFAISSCPERQTELIERRPRKKNTLSPKERDGWRDTRRRPDVSADSLTAADGPSDGGMRREGRGWQRACHDVPVLPQQDAAPSCPFLLRSADVRPGDVFR